MKKKIKLLLISSFFALISPLSGENYYPETDKISSSARVLFVTTAHCGVSRTESWQKKNAHMEQKYISHTKSIAKGLGADQIKVINHAVSEKIGGTKTSKLFVGGSTDFESIFKSKVNPTHIFIYGMDLSTKNESVVSLYIAGLAKLEKKGISIFVFHPFAKANPAFKRVKNLSILDEAAREVIQITDPKSGKTEKVLLLERCRKNNFVSIVKTTGGQQFKMKADKFYNYYNAKNL